MVPSRDDYRAPVALAAVSPSDPERTFLPRQQQKVVFITRDEHLFHHGLVCRRRSPASMNWPSMSRQQHQRSTPERCRGVHLAPGPCPLSAWSSPRLNRAVYNSYRRRRPGFLLRRPRSGQVASSAPLPLSADDVLSSTSAGAAPYPPAAPGFDFLVRWMVMTTYRASYARQR